jgi:hypothetical protein
MIFDALGPTKSIHTTAYPRHTNEILGFDHGYSVWILIR